MKKLLSILSLYIFFGCGGGSDEPTPPPSENKAPSVPSLVSPTHNQLCTNNTLEFMWTTAVDPEGDLINYEIEVARDNQFLQVVSKKTVATLSTIISLDKGIAHYWRVRAVDNKGKASEYTNFWSFYTEGVGVVNYVPFVAVIVKPIINSTISGTSTILEWNASDVDISDVLTYDIYFGTNANPPLLINSHPSKTYTVTGLLPNTTYFWRIDVKDNKGGKSTGQLWSFKTS